MMLLRPSGEDERERRSLERQERDGGTAAPRSAPGSGGAQAGGAWPFSCPPRPAGCPAGGEGAGGHGCIPTPHGAPTPLPAHRGQTPSQTSAAVPSIHIYSHTPSIHVHSLILEGQEEQPLFCLEKGHFKSWFCFAELLAEQWTSGAWPVLGTEAVAGAEPTHGAQRGSLRHESWPAVALGAEGSRNGSISFHFWWSVEVLFGIRAVFALPAAPRGCAAGLGSG